MKYEDFINEVKSKMAEVKNDIKQYKSLAELYLDFKLNPTININTVMANPLLKDNEVFKEASITLKTYITQNIAKNKAIAEFETILPVKYNEAYSKLKDIMYSTFLSLDNDYKYLTSSLLDLDLKQLNDKRNHIERTIDKSLFLRKANVYFNTIFRGSLIKHGQLNDLFSNLSNFLKRITDVSNINSEKVLAKKVNDFSDNFQGKLKSYPSTQEEMEELKKYFNQYNTNASQTGKTINVVDTDLDNIINIISNNELNKVSGIKDSPEEVFLKFNSLVNEIILSFQKIKDKIHNDYNYFATHLKDSVFEFFSWRMQDAFDKCFTRCRANNEPGIVLLNGIDVGLLVCETEEILLEFLIRIGYNYKAIYELYIFIFNVIYKLTLETSMDETISNSKN